MGFTATPTDGSSTPIPMSSAVPDGTNTPLATEGGPAKTTGGNQLVPVATYQYDGYNVVEGATTDAAVTGDNGGTLSAKLRGLTKIFTDVWDSVNHRLHVNVDAGNITETNSAAIKTDLDTVVTNTNKIPASPATEGGHLATIDTSTSNANAAIGTKTDSKATDGSTTAWSVIALLKGIIDKLLSTLAVTQSGTWTVQPGNTANTTAWKVDGSGVAQPVAVFNGSVNQTWSAVDNVGDNSHTGIGVIAQSAYNGNPNYTYDRLRVANVFKTATATATGDTVVWTPTTGTKFRIMAYAVYVTQNAAISGGGMLEILLRDATVSLGLGFSVYCPSAAGTTFGAGASSGWVLLGNSKLSAALNNALNVNLSAALTAGEVRVVAIGMEE